MEWKRRGTWWQQGRYALLMDAASVEPYRLTPKVASRALTEAAELAANPSLPAWTASPPIEGHPGPGGYWEPEDDVLPLFHWLERFGPLDHSEPIVGTRVDLADAVLLGHLWRDWQEVKAPGTSGRQAAIDRVAAAVQAELARLVDPFHGGHPPSIRPDLRRSGSGNHVVIDTRPVTLRGVLLLTMLDDTLQQPEKGHCSHPGCDATFVATTGKRGRPPLTCPEHRPKAAAKRAERMRQAFRSLKTSDLEAILEEGDE